jgi:hypothetical protein
MEWSGIVLYRDIWAGVILKLLVSSPSSIVALGQVSQLMRKWVLSSKALRMCAFGVVMKLSKPLRAKMHKKQMSPWNTMLTWNKGYMEEKWRLEQEIAAINDANSFLTHKTAKCVVSRISCECVALNQRSNSRLRGTTVVITVGEHLGKPRVMKVFSNYLSMVGTVPVMDLYEVDLREMASFGIWKIECQCCSVVTVVAMSPLSSSFQHLFPDRRTRYTPSLEDECAGNWFDYARK